MRATRQSALSSLEQGIVPRDQFEALFKRLVSHATDEQVIDVSHLDVGAGKHELHTPPPPAPALEQASGKLELALYSDKKQYKIDETVAFTVQSTKDCFLTLVDISPRRGHRAAAQRL